MAYVDPHCRGIAAKAAKGKLTEAEIMDTFAAIGERERQMRAQGQLTGKSERIRKWAEDQGERTKIAAAAARRHAALNIVIRQKVDTQFKALVAGGLPPHQALRAILEGINSPAEGSRQSVAAAQQAYEARYLGGIFADIAGDRPHILDNLNDPKLDADLLTEMWETRKGGTPGSTKNPDAQWLAGKFADYAELSRTELNRLGASIGKLDGWAGVQVHDDVKMIKAGKDAWIGRIVTLLDHERTFPEGATQLEAANALGDIYDTIITGLSNEATAAERGQRVNPANLAKSLGKSRVLHFKDAGAALTYRSEFGYSNTIAGMISHLRNAAHKAGVMEMLGPNPEVMFKAVAATAGRAIKDSKTIADADKPKLMGKLKTDAGAMRHALDVSTGMVSRPVNVTAAKLGSDIRAVQSMAKLGAALPSSFSDVVTAGLASQFRGSGFLAGVARQLGGMMKGRPKGEQARIAYMVGEGFDGLIGHVAAAAAANDGPRGRMGWLQEVFFKLNGLTWWTDVGRSVVGRNVAAELGMHAGTDMGKLPPELQHVMRQAGIKPDEWAVMGKGAMRMDNGKPYLTPDRIRDLDDADIAPLVQGKIDAINASKSSADVKAQRIANLMADTRRGLEVKMLSYLADQTSYGIIESDNRTRRYTTGGHRPGTFAGEATRLVMQFKGFPLAFSTRVFGRALFGYAKSASWGEAVGKRIPHMGALIAGLTVAGYAAMVAKDMLKGYWPPRNPADPRTIMAAMQQGGAWGIYGDYLFSQVNRFGGGITETALGPSIGAMGDLANIALDARDAAVSGGEDKFSGAQAFSNIIGNVPFANLHLVKPALDYLIINSVREKLSPGYLRKLDKSRFTEYGQKRLGIPGAPPALYPFNMTRSF